MRLLEPDRHRRETLGRLCVELARSAGRDDLVLLTEDPEEALSDVDVVFSAVRVGGDVGRTVDEEVAIERGLVGQETTGPGGFAMALRTIPVVLRYCELLRRLSPDAVVVNFTNPAGIVTQAITSHGGVRAIGVCDTPSSTVERLASFLGLEAAEVGYDYAGLNHLGWVTSLRAPERRGGDERMADLVERYDELRGFDHRFAAFDSELVRWLGMIPCEYDYYYCYPRRYLAAVARAGTTRGRGVAALNEQLLVALGRAWEEGGAVSTAWAAYTGVMATREGSYMALDVDGQSLEGPSPDRAALAIGGYEAVALGAMEALRSPGGAEMIVDVQNGGAFDFLEADDVIEVRARISPEGVAAQRGPALARWAQGLLVQVKEYEREVVSAAVEGSARRAAAALALHPLVPGVDVARELVDAYRRRHGEVLAYLR